MKTIKYGEAIHSAMSYAMEKDPSVIVMGLGVDDHKAIFGTTKGMKERFGKDRIFDTPISEGAMTGVAVGAALNGLKPIHIHIRSDFLYLAMDQLLNMAAKWRYMYGGSMNIPITVRAVIGKSWGQGAQHSQSLQSLFMHIPGIKVIMPTTPEDAQDLLFSSIHDPDPVIIFEHRLLYDIPGEVSDTPQIIPLKKAVVRKKGKDVTIVANSYLVAEALKACEFLEQNGISVEVVDPVTLVPLDETTIIDSIKKTGKLIVVDTSWTSCGVSAEIAALAAEKAFTYLKQPVVRIGNAPATCPVSKPLENAFYPNAKTIAAEVFKILGKKIPNVEVPVLTTKFKGPF